MVPDHGHPHRYEHQHRRPRVTSRPTRAARRVARRCRCAPEVHGADTVTFQTFETFPELYAAYLDKVEQISASAPSMDQMAVGDCNSTMSSGEVTWNPGTSTRAPS